MTLQIACRRISGDARVAGAALTRRSNGAKVSHSGDTAATYPVLAALQLCAIATLGQRDGDKVRAPGEASFASGSCGVSGSPAGWGALWARAGCSVHMSETDGRPGYGEQAA